MDDALTPLDITNCYRLVLGRDPESPDVIEDKLRQPKKGLLPDFFSSSEFNEGVRPKITGPSPPQPTFRLPPSADLKAWAARFVPLSRGGAEAVLAADGWAGLYHALFADDLFSTSILDETARAKSPVFLAALTARQQLENANHLEGRVELVTTHEIRGWALNLAAPQRRLSLELWIDGVFRAAVTPDRYRPELFERFGGHGVFGFAMARPPEPAGAGPLRAEIREAQSGSVIDVLQLPEIGLPPVDTAIALRRELAEVRVLLSRIEQRLPDLAEAYSFKLDLYGDYFDTVYTQRRSEEGGTLRLSSLTVVVDAADGSTAELDGALASLAGQTCAPALVLVTHPGMERLQEFQHAISLWQGRFDNPGSPQGLVTDGGWSAMMQAAAAIGERDILALDSQTRLAPDAVERVTETLEAGAALVYADSDEVETGPAGETTRHQTPCLRTTFDPELFLQQGDLGPLIGLSRSFVEKVGRTSGRKEAGFYDFVLRGLRCSPSAPFVHVPSILSHVLAGRAPRPMTSARLAALEDHLAAHRPGAKAALHADAFNANMIAALRVRDPVPAGVRATVIVPTRDRLDLLEPCLQSLAATVMHNQVSIDFVVVDNQSRESETFEFLERFGRSSPLRVVKYSGAFNWALMNNLAAIDANTDVLIFLNNDTMTLTADWCNELCSQAMRPEVGVVGARLLYGDGTIQHAGMVIGGWHAFVAHEGVGAPASDPGYMGRHILLRETSAVTGACLATRKTVFDSLGGFDALNLPVENNDVDYCLRVRGVGLKVLYDPYCTFYHYESKSRGLNLDAQKRAQAEAAGAFMRAKWGERYRVDPFYNPHFDRVASPLTHLAPRYG